MKARIAILFNSLPSRKALQILRALVSVALCMTAWGFALKDMDQSATTAVRILWTDAHGLHMLKDSDIHALLGPVQGRPKARIYFMEQTLRSLPYFSEVNLCYDSDNQLNVILNHREPVLRVFPEHTLGYYLAADGVGLPLKPDFAAPVPLCLGKVPQRPHGTAQPGNKGIILALKAREWIAGDTLLEALITQYVVAGDDSNALMLRTLTGQEIWLGTSMDMALKLSKLSSFYRLAPADSAPDLFRHLNLVFKNQIVCR
jgi:hypothetical protein